MLDPLGLLPVSAAGAEIISNSLNKVIPANSLSGQIGSGTLLGLPNPLSQILPTVGSQSSLLSNPLLSIGDASGSSSGLMSMLKPGSVSSMISEYTHLSKGIVCNAHLLDYLFLCLQLI